MMNTYNSDTNKGDDNPWWWLIGITAAAWLCGLLAGCTSPRYVTVPEYHTEYVTKRDSVLTRDTLIMRDSVVMYLQGDTVYKEKYAVRDRLKYVYKATTDTLIRTDSVRVPYPIEAQLTKWQKTQMAVGKWCLYALSGIALAGLAWLALWLWRKTH